MQKICNSSPRIRLDAINLSLFHSSGAASASKHKNLLFNFYQSMLSSFILHWFLFIQLFSGTIKCIYVFFVPYTGASHFLIGLSAYKYTVFRYEAYIKPILHSPLTETRWEHILINSFFLIHWVIPSYCRIFDRS